MTYSIGSSIPIQHREPVCTSKCQIVRKSTQSPDLLQAAHPIRPECDGGSNLQDRQSNGIWHRVSQNERNDCMIEPRTSRNAVACSKTWICTFGRRWRVTAALRPAMPPPQIAITNGIAVGRTLESGMLLQLSRLGCSKAGSTPSKPEKTGSSWRKRQNIGDAVESV